MADISNRIKVLFVALFLGAILLPISMNVMTEPLGVQTNETIGTADGSGMLTANVSDTPIDQDYNVTVWANNTELQGDGTDYTVTDYEEGTISVDSTDATSDEVTVSYKMDMGMTDTMWTYLPLIGLLAVLMAMIKKFV